MDSRLGLAVYLLIAAAAGFVTASRNLPLPLLFGILLALALAAVLVRRSVIGPAGPLRVSAAFIGMYLLTYVAFVLVLR